MNKNYILVIIGVGIILYVAYTQPTTPPIPVPPPVQKYQVGDFIQAPDGLWQVTQIALYGGILQYYVTRSPDGAIGYIPTSIGNSYPKGSPPLPPVHTADIVLPPIKVISVDSVLGTDDTVVIPPGWKLQWTAGRQVAIPPCSLLLPGDCFI